MTQPANKRLVTEAAQATALAGKLDTSVADATLAPLVDGVVKSDTAPADTSRMWLDTSTVVPAPFVPSSAFVSLNAAASVPTAFASGITVPFDLVSHDDAGYWDNTNKKFIAQTAGRYVLRSQVSWANDDTGERWIEIWSSRSGPRVYGSFSGHPLVGSVVDDYQCQFGPFQFAAGATFWVVARHTATTTPLSLGLNARTWFSIEKVG